MMAGKDEKSVKRGVLHFFMEMDEWPERGR
jgi:hypothetical protein